MQDVFVSSLSKYLDNVKYIYEIIESNKLGRIIMQENKYNMH